MVIKLFKGQVKIADVKAAFDEIIEKVNTMITDYNNSSYIQDIDYSVAGSTLAPSGYTLTVGGMKQFMDSCDGSVVGGKPFKVNSNRFKMSTGLLVTKDGIYRLPDSILDIPTDKQYRTVYYNTATGEYQWTGEGTISVVKPVTVEVSSDMTAYQDYGYLLPIGERARTLDQYYGAYYHGGYNYTYFGQFSLEQNTKEVLEDGKVIIPMHRYPHICLDSSLSYGDKITVSSNDVSLVNKEISSAMLGHLDSDGETFTPLLRIDDYATMNNNYVWARVGGVSTTGYNAEISKNEELYAYIPKYETGELYGIYNHWSGWNKVEWEFGKPDELGVSKITCTHYNKDGTIASITISSGIDIAKYNINCVMFGNNAEANTENATSPLGLAESNFYHKTWYSVTQGGGISYLNTDSQNLITNEVVVEESDSAAYRICDINPDADTKLISNIKGVQNEKVNGTYKITSESRWVKPVCGVDKPSSGFRGETPDTSKNSLFIWGQEAQSNTDEGGYGIPKLYLFGKMVQWNRKPAHRRLDWWSPLNMLFVPKGVENPYTYDEKYNDFTHWFKVNISKNIKDT